MKTAHDGNGGSRMSSFGPLRLRRVRRRPRGVFRGQKRRSYGEGLAGITGRGYGAARKEKKTVRYFAYAKRHASSPQDHLEL